MPDELNAEPSLKQPSDVRKAKLLEAAGWGLLLVWLGITLLLAIGGPIFLIGTGVIVLTLQTVRANWNLETETFWLILGVVFVGAGVAESFGLGVSPVPLALILLGLAVLYDVYKRTQKHNS